ncbi:MAG: hypothetical protein JWL69_3436 [Phycisphaerales bacterium]|nr:hypothetical protein [Phycisphaerales bacterium]
MAVSTKTRILIWSRAANRCCICRSALFMNDVSTDNPSLVGDIAHIVAESPDGPRGDSPLTADQRDLYANLILLSKAHHKLVDDNHNAFAVAKLQEIKAAHEHWVCEALQGFDAAKQRSIEIYANYIQEWGERAALDRWEGWTSYLLGSGQPQLAKEDTVRIAALQDWLFNRVWPDHFPSLRTAFENFRRVLSDLHQVFLDGVDDHDRDRLYTAKRYHRARTDEDRARAERMFSFQVDLVFDLTLELTRAANYVCDRVRELLDPNFRMLEGVVIATSGPYMIFNWKKHRAEYRDGERTEMPYAGLREFMVVRKDRDYHWGEGTSIDDPDCRCAE